LHNSDDLLQLARVLRVFDGLDLHKIVSHVGFPVQCGASFAFVSEIKLERNALEFSGKCRAFSPFDCVRFDEPWRISFQSETERFNVRVPCRHKAGVVFADLAELGADERDFAADPAYGSGYLALKQGKEVLYGSMNRLIKHIARTAIARLSPFAR
jgi:hypothetical protein